MAKAKTNMRTKTKSTRTLELSASRDIPLDRLVLSQSNVRQVKAGVSVDELAEDITRRTLLQSLTVRPVIDDAGAETGFFEIPAGGRRFRALQLLVSQKRLAADATIPCVIRTDGLAEEDSLAENIQRAPLHPLDQFRAFQTLREKGKSEEEIAAAFFVSVNVVKQRLKLAAVAPSLLDFYAEDELTLDQLMAFTVNPDHQRQVEVWEALKRRYNREPYQIRRMLTEGAIRAGDKRARFIGVEAYEAAGGVVLRDLFAEDGDGWLQDAWLVNRLVAEKLETDAATIKAEGWKWVEAATEFPYGYSYDLRRIDGERVPLTDEEQIALTAAKDEFDALQASHESSEELPDEVDARLGELEAIIEALEERPYQYPPEEIARAGVFVSIDPSGALRIERGFVRPEDEPPVEEAASTRDENNAAGAHAENDGDGANSTALADDESDEDDGARAIPDRLMIELTEWRTVALRDAVAKDPGVAFVAALHAMCLDLFYMQGAPRCVSINVRQVPLRSGAARLADCAAAASIDARHRYFADKLPDQPVDLWGTIAAMDEETRKALFAHCVGQSIDAVYKPYDRRSNATIEADHIARIVAHDLRAAGWLPTAEGYFGRVTKAQILDAVREAKGADAGERLAGLKKTDMAKAAEGLLVPTAWVPAIFRTESGVASVDESSPDAVAPLTEEASDADASADESPSAAIAAE